MERRSIVERRGPVERSLSCAAHGVLLVVAPNLIFFVIQGVTACVWLVWNACTDHVLPCFRHIDHLIGVLTTPSNNGTI